MTFGSEKQIFFLGILLGFAFLAMRYMDEVLQSDKWLDW